MDILDVFKLTNNKYFISLKKNKIFIEAYLKNNFFSIKSEENGIIKLDDIKNKNLNEYELEKMETLIWMLKYGFNKVRGSIFKHINLLVKEFETIRDLIKQNIEILNEYEINQEWETDLNNCIEKEKIIHKNTRCFMCAKKGHFAIDCKELYDIDGICVDDNNNECKYYKKNNKNNNKDKFKKTVK